MARALLDGRAMMRRLCCGAAAFAALGLVTACSGGAGGGKDDGSREQSVVADETSESAPAVAAEPSRLPARAWRRGGGGGGDSSASWWRTYAGDDTSARDAAVDVAIDARGRAVVLATLADHAMGIVVYRADGSTAWSRAFKDSGDDADVAAKLALDARGNVFAAGSWKRSGATSSGFVVVSYDADGALRWSARSEAGGDVADLAVSASGRAVVTGAGTDGAHALARTIVFGDDGRVVWSANELGPLGFGANARRVAIDRDGNTIVAGESSDGSHDQVTLFAYDARGAALYTTRANEDVVHVPQSTTQALALDANGAPHVASARAFRTSRDAEPKLQMAITKYDHAGAPQWSATTTQGTRAIANAIAVDSAGRVTATGFAGSPSPDSYLTVQYDAAGAAQWADRHAWSTPGAHQARALVVDAHGNAYVTGAAIGADGAASFGTIAYATSGAKLWTDESRDPSRAYSAAAAIARDDSGRLYVAGSVLSSPRGVVGLASVVH